MIKPATRTTLYEEVTKQIIDVIKQGKWVPGERIPGEIELAKNFEVSRNCIREALKALELSGIISSKPGRGTYLTADAIQNIRKMELLWLLKDKSSIVELMETRLVLEVQLAYIAAERADKADIEKLEAILKECEDAINNKSYSVDFGFEFHMMIAKIAKNQIMTKFLNSITDGLIAQRGMLIIKHLNKEEYENEHLEHKAIFEHIKNGEAEEARTAMYYHLYNAMKILNKDFENKVSDLGYSLNLNN